MKKGVFPKVDYLEPTLRTHFSPFMQVLHKILISSV